ncbi:peptidoglycan-binding protein [Metabacillus herbersteinensis]|uniref:Peptidoglycan-binding protein n=1 Tax=Metabacillus herbersteinensis TaxID=283816 RepID=A0ABV6GLP5_9BACI
MKKFLVGLICIVMFLVQGLLVVTASAEGPKDVPSASYIDEEKPEQRMELLSLSRGYARAFSCNGKSSWTLNSTFESEGYNWIVRTGVKGYIQDGGPGGATLGVVLKDKIIDFDHGYLLKKGNSGNNRSYVTGVQSTLSCLGYSVGGIDGVFGAQTEAAVKAFQQRKGISADGIVGKQTYHYLSFSTY